MTGPPPELSGGWLPLQSGGLRGPEQEESGLKAEFCLKNFLLETSPEGVQRSFNEEQLHCDQPTGDIFPSIPHSAQFFENS